MASSDDDFPLITTTDTDTTNPPNPNNNNNNNNFHRHLLLSSPPPPPPAEADVDGYHERVYCTHPMTGALYENGSDLDRKRSGLKRFGGNGSDVEKKRSGLMRFGGGGSDPDPKRSGFGGFGGDGIDPDPKRSGLKSFGGNGSDPDPKRSGFGSFGGNGGNGSDPDPKRSDFDGYGGNGSDPDPKRSGFDGYGGNGSDPDPKRSGLSGYGVDGSDPDPKRSELNGSWVNGVRGEKWNDGEEVSDGGTPYSKKAKVSASSSGGEYRKDREEWSDAGIACLLDAYLDKFLQLSRGNLRGRDWEEVAVTVSERCEKQTKSVEQCKNKVDNLKKRYKLERHRMMNASGGVTTSHWPWFKKMEQIVGNSLPMKAVLGEDHSGSGLSSPGRQSKRYATATSNPSLQITNIKTKPVANARWSRVVFKISGASLAGTGSHSADPKVAMLIAREVSMVCNVGVEVAIVVGGRNFFCGDTWVAATGMDRSTAYQIGMMATVMNSMLIQSELEKLGVQTRVQSAFSMPEVSEPYNKQRAIRHLEKGRVVIFGGIGAGTGNPLFSTDTAGALRASEIHADAFIKGTNADGVYECDTINNVAFEHISFRELASRDASPMDSMAATFCEENGIPVVIFNIHEPGNISRALSGEHVGTLIDQTGRIE